MNGMPAVLRDLDELVDGIFAEFKAEVRRARQRLDPLAVDRDVRQVFGQFDRLDRG